MALLVGRRVFALKNVRIVFSKTGRAKYVSHLDLMRTMTRAVRRAQIPLWYTEGFNRHPYLTFAAPLSLGHEGLRETVDIRLEEDMPFDQLVFQLNEVLPEGIVAVSAAEAVDKVKDLVAAEYTLTIHAEATVVSELLNSNEITVEKRTKKKTMKTIDIKPYFANAVVSEDGEGACKMDVTLPCGSAENINPSLISAALNAHCGEEIKVEYLRKRLTKADSTEFL